MIYTIDPTRRISAARAIAESDGHLRKNGKVTWDTMSDTLRQQYLRNADAVIPVVERGLIDDLVAMANRWGFADVAIDGEITIEGWLRGALDTGGDDDD